MDDDRHDMGGSNRSRSKARYHGAMLMHTHHSHPANDAALGIPCSAYARTGKTLINAIGKKRSFEHSLRRRQQFI
jgi:hypothetical protein